MSGPVLLMLCVLLSAAASVFLKMGSSALTEPLNFSLIVSNRMIWAGGFFYSSAFLAYIYVLRVVPLSLAQPVITVGVSVVTVLIAVIFLKETMAVVNWIGLVLIVTGVIFLFWSRT